MPMEKKNLSHLFNCLYYSNSFSCARRSKHQVRCRLRHASYNVAHCSVLLKVPLQLNVKQPKCKHTTSVLLFFYGWVGFCCHSNNPTSKYGCAMMIHAFLNTDLSESCGPGGGAFDSVGNSTSSSLCWTARSTARCWSLSGSRLTVNSTWNFILSMKLFKNLQNHICYMLDRVLNLKLRGINNTWIQRS